MFTVYVLRSLLTGEFYTGSTAGFDRRFTQHQEGMVRSTKHGRPWELVHREEFATRAEAVRRERYLKTGRGRQELRLLLEKAGKL
jgi:putative endonuclease